MLLQWYKRIFVSITQTSSQKTIFSPTPYPSSSIISLSCSPPKNPIFGFLEGNVERERERERWKLFYKQKGFSLYLQNPTLGLSTFFHHKGSDIDYLP
jgi:hypothetical protein